MIYKPFETEGLSEAVISRTMGSDSLDMKTMFRAFWLRYDRSELTDEDLPILEAICEYGKAHLDNMAADPSRSLAKNVEK